MVRFAYHLGVKTVLVLALVCTVLYVRAATSVGYDSTETIFVHPTWMSTEVGARVGGARTALPYVCTVLLAGLWGMWAYATILVRRIFPREA
jgi:hypothetical protein